MSSPDNEQPEGPPKGPDAPIESPGPDDAATAADQESAADRGEVKAPGAPAEPTSDTEGTGVDADGPQQVPPDTTAPDTTAPDTTAPDTIASEGAGTTPAGSDAGAAATPSQPGDEQPALAGEGEAADAAAEAADVPVAEEPDDAAAEAADVPVAEEPDDAPPPFDEDRSPMLDLLREHLGDAVLETHLQPGVDAWARIRLDAWVEAAEVCRDRLGLTYFCFLSAIDWLPSPFGKSEDDAAPTAPPSDWSELAHGVAGGATRFQLLARLQAARPNAPALTLKADLPDDDLRAPTWSRTYPGADWHEREAWDMFGIRFDGHPHLVHIYLPGDFEGHPLRKDFPLLSRMVKPWPGLVDVEPMPGEDAEDDAEAAAE